MFCRRTMCGQTLGLTAAALGLLLAACGTTPAPAPDIRATLEAASLTPAAIVRARQTIQEGPETSTPLRVLRPCGSPCLGPLADEEGLAARVVRVIDGDTIDAVFTDGSIDRVRLLGIDTPETNSPNRAYKFGNISDTACLDSWGVLATEFTAELLTRRWVDVLPDPQAGARDRIGRMLAYISVDGADFNGALVEGGFARVYAEGDSNREADYLELEERARLKGVGLWQCGPAK